MTECGTKRRKWTPVFDGEVVRIPLSQGLFSTIDKDDLPLVSGASWHVTGLNVGRPYAIGTVSGRRVMMHVHIMKPKKGLIVDHRDRNGLMNRRSNLRFCSKAQNGQNCITKGGKVIYKGVNPHASGLFSARIRVGGKTISLRYHKTPEDAARAYDLAAIKYFGEFALTNKQMGLI